MFELNFQVASKMSDENDAIFSKLNPSFEIFFCCKLAQLFVTIVAEVMAVMAKKDFSKIANPKSR